MNKKSGKTDRRKHKRFRVIDDTFVIFGSASLQKCLITDISLGGLSFRYYTGTKEIKEFRPVHSGKLDIIRVSDNFSIRQIPFDTVYDIEFDDEISWKSFKTRKSGVKFIRLTRQHRSQLERFIKENAMALSKEYASEEF